MRWWRRDRVRGRTAEGSAADVEVFAHAGATCLGLPDGRWVRLSFREVTDLVRVLRETAVDVERRRLVRTSPRTGGRRHAASRVEIRRR